MLRPTLNPATFGDPDDTPEPSRWRERVARVISLMLKTPQLLRMDLLRRLSANAARQREGLPPPHILRGLLRLALILCALLPATFVASAWMLTHPARGQSVRTPNSIGLHYEDRVLHTTDRRTLAAWWIPPLAEDEVLRQREQSLTRQRRAVVLVHDFAATRDDLLPMVLPLHARGMGVLLLATRGCDGSDASTLTFGLREAMDVDAAVTQAARELGMDPSRIRVGGVGTGGVAAALAAQHGTLMERLVLIRPPATLAESIARHALPARLGVGSASIETPRAYAAMLELTLCILNATHAERYEIDLGRATVVDHRQDAVAALLE